MDIMVVVTGGGRWTDKMARLFIQCFELQPGVRVYRWMRHFKPIEVGCHAGGAVTVETATLFSDIQNLHAAIHADSYGLLWTVVPTLLIFPFDVKTTKGTPPPGLCFIDRLQMATVIHAKTDPVAVAPVIAAFPCYPVNRLEKIEYRYFTEKLRRYYVAGQPWRACVNGLASTSDPLAGCIGTRIVGGLKIPLREFAYTLEDAAGRVSTPVARECVECMISSVKTRMLPHNRSTMACTEGTHTIQPFYIDPASWPADCVVYPENVHGVYNGLCAPFVRWNPRLLCSINELGFFRIGYREPDVPTMTTAEILAVLLSDHAILQPDVDLDERCAMISALMLVFRGRPTQRLASFYLGLYLDSFIPAFRQRHGLTGTALPLSQLTLPDHIENFDLVTHTPMTPIAGVVARSFRLMRRQKFNIKNRPTDAECIDFVRDCVRVSMLGNYYDARFANLQCALTIKDRIEIVDTGYERGMHASLVDVAIAEYGVTLIQEHPPMQLDGVVWPDFVALMKQNADRCLRGAGVPDKCAPVLRDTPVVADAAAVRIVACAMQTGTLSAYMCTTCSALSAYVDGRQRGLVRMRIAVDPFSTPNDNEPVKCSACNSVSVHLDLSGCMMLYPGGYMLAVCPDCNFLAAHRGMMRSTVCDKCATRKHEVQDAVKVFCQVDGRRIYGRVLDQMKICRETQTLLCVPVCEYHFKEIATFIN